MSIKYGLLFSIKVLFKRFPAPIIVCVLFCISFIPTLCGLQISWLDKIPSYILISIPAFVYLNLFSKLNKLSPINNIISYFLVLFLMGIIFSGFGAINSELNSESILKYKLATLSIIYCLLLTVLPFDQKTFSEDIYIRFNKFVFLQALISAILFTTTLLFIIVIQFFVNIFIFEGDTSHVNVTATLICILLFAYIIHFLLRIPEDIEDISSCEISSKYILLIHRYILMPAILISFLIFYIYIVKTIFKGEFVGILLLDSTWILLFIGLFSYIFFKSLNYPHNQKKSNFFYDNFFIFIIPVNILSWVEIHKKFLGLV